MPSDARLSATLVRGTIRLSANSHSPVLVSSTSAVSGSSSAAKSSAEPNVTLAASRIGVACSAAAVQAAGSGSSAVVVAVSSSTIAWTSSADWPSVPSEYSANAASITAFDSMPMLGSTTVENGAYGSTSVNSTVVSSTASADARNGSRQTDGL